MRDLPEEGEEQVVFEETSRHAPRGPAEEVSKR